MGNLFTSCSEICTPSSSPYVPVPSTLPFDKPSSNLQGDGGREERRRDNTEELNDIVRECSRRMVRVQDAGVKDFDGVMGEVVWMEAVGEPNEGGKWEGEWEGELVENL
ncbi:hypothetical protein TrLO_g14349 [Triparma laevis f. longispina]|uniref:Uncharacterized protein n=1 Tax=Triparma laevis f. longispina TaxID=1714387 RepID=A0A9W7DZM7_9STRA|nr:hypothetical protein TrLO_g14349 [Triparma laevis f. longispina]